MTPPKLYTVTHALDGLAVEFLERRAALLGTHPDVLILKYVREAIDRMMLQEAQEQMFQGEGR